MSHRFTFYDRTRRHKLFHSRHTAKNVTHIQVTGLLEINPFLHRVEKHMFYLGLSAFFFTCCFTTKQIPLVNLRVWLFNGCFWELRQEFSDSC